MKKWVGLASISVVIIGLTSVGGVVLTQSGQQSTLEPVSIKFIHPLPEAPQAVVAVEALPEPTQASGPIQSVPSVPTNEELVAQYGWTSGTNRSSIDYIMWMFPEHFTDGKRVASFQYLQSVASSNRVVGTEPKTINSIDFVKWYFMQHFQKESWVNVGTLAGIDTSRYE